MMATFLGFNLVVNAKANDWMDCGLLFVFYGLYYGVLGRDISEICADKMAAHIGVSIAMKIYLILKLFLWAYQPYFNIMKFVSVINNISNFFRINLIDEII